MITACALAFGGNSPNSEDIFQRAIVELTQTGTACLSFAEVIRSAPMGAAAGSEFVNSVGVFKTSLPPELLLKAIHEIETGLGRQRSLRWGPRPIDIDVLFYGQQIIDTPTVVIPHPCLWYRSFVLKPLNQISPDWTHPILNQSVAQLHERLTKRPMTLRILCQEPIFSARQIAVEYWREKDGDFQVLRDDDMGIEPFCELVFEPAEVPSVSGEKSRTQPRHESRRIIRCPVPLVNAEETVRQFLRDFEAAVLG